MPTQELEIDLMDLLRKIIGIRKKIYKAAGIGLIIGVIVAVSIPKQYTVEVTLSPEMCIRDRGKNPFFVMLDGVTDVRNFGEMCIRDRYILILF